MRWPCMAPMRALGGIEAAFRALGGPPSLIPSGGAMRPPLPCGSMRLPLPCAAAPPRHRGSVLQGDFATPQGHEGEEEEQEDGGGLGLDEGEEEEGGEDKDGEVRRGPPAR